MFRRFDSFEDFNKFIDSPDVKVQWLVEKKISEDVYKADESVPAGESAREKIFGYCAVCGKARVFYVDLKWSDGTNVNFRERLICGECGLTNRQRLMAAYIREILKDSVNPAIYIQEKVTKFFKFLSGRYDNVTGSEYLGVGSEPGEIIGGVRHEDCMSLSFGGESFDLVVSNDVFGHVGCVYAAFKEAYRVLKPDGKLIFTVPCHTRSASTVKRAGFENGKLVHYREPVYHGNPVSSDGSLVFFDYGRDILEFLNGAGFCGVEIICSDSYAHGHYSVPWLLKAEKH